MKLSKRNIIISAVLGFTVLASFSAIIMWRSGSLNNDPKITSKANNTYNSTLKVLTDEDYKPYSFFNKKGDMLGHDVELANIIANKLEMNLEIELVPWDEAIARTNSGEADLLMTCDYSDSFDTGSLEKTSFTSYDNFTVFSKKKIDAVESLFDKKIGIMEGGNVTNDIERLDLLKNCTTYVNNREAMRGLMKNEVDVAIMRNSVGETLLTELGARNSIKSYIAFTESYMCFCYPTSKTAIGQKVDQVLAELKSDGTLSKLHSKWLTTFAKKLTFRETLENNPWIVIAFVIAILLLATFFMFLRDTSIKYNKERERILSIADNLSSDFECVTYIDAKDGNFAAQLIRVSDTISKCIPDWPNEHNMQRRIDLLIENIVAEQDAERFRQATTIECVNDHIAPNVPYYVNFKAKIDDELKYYQLKFNGVYDDKKNLTGYILGIHNVDDTTRANVEMREKLAEALERAEASQIKLAEDRFLFDSFMSTYFAAFSVDLINETFEVLSMNHEFKNQFSINGGQREMIEFVNNHVVEEDRELVMQNIDKNYVSAKLRETPNYTFYYREVFDGNIRHMKAIISKGIDEYHVAVGFMKKE